MTAVVANGPIVGNDGAITIGGVTVASVKTFTVDMKRGTLETTTMGKDVKTFVKGLGEWSGTADIYFDVAQFADSATFQFNPSIGFVGDLPTTGVKFYVAKPATGTQYVFTGDVIITDYQVKVAMDGIVESTITFQGSGTANAGVTFGNS